VILHVQSRGLPLNHSGLRSELPAVIAVAGVDLEVERSTMTTLVYRRQPTVELDATPLYREVGLPGQVRLRWVRVRAVPAGLVTLSVAVEHDRDLGDLGAHALADLDADLNALIRREDADILTQLLAALDADILCDARCPIGDAEAPAGGLTAPDATVRYNCHLITPSPGWTPSPRLATAASELAGSSCIPLLPYTFAWALDPQAPPPMLLASLEPADVAVGQRSVLFAAEDEALHVLDELSSGRPPTVSPLVLRRRLDRSRVTCSRLGSYRYDSSQDHRGVYLAACREMGLDQLWDRVEQQLGQASSSLDAAVATQVAALDGRLNRLAAVLTVATASVLVLELIGFARAGTPLQPEWRAVTLAALAVAGTAALAWVFVRSRRLAGLGDG
jgi:hypothetical protein